MSDEKELTANTAAASDVPGANTAAANEDADAKPAAEVEQFAIFWEKVEKKRNGCWGWTGKLKAGRGRLFIGKRLITAHRFAWALVNGAIPDDHDIVKRDKNCEGYCVNPEHRVLVERKSKIRENSCRCPLCGR